MKQELKQFSENLKSDPDYFCKEGEKSVNRKKNRYKDILPCKFKRDLCFCSHVICMKISSNCYDLILYLS